MGRTLGHAIDQNLQLAVGDCVDQTRDDREAPIMLLREMPG